MNNCYTNQNEFRREHRMEEYRSEVMSRTDLFLDRLFALIAAMVTLFTRPAVRRAVRYVMVAVCFFCFLGLIGGIEKELISVGIGVVLGLLLIFVEILCLR